MKPTAAAAAPPVEKKPESSEESDAHGEEANLDWADDKPMDWSEKIVFSDDDQSNKSATPQPEPEVENGYDRYDNYDRNNPKSRSYNNRHYENHYENRRNYRPQQPQVQQGFYDDHERQYYANDLEKTRDENLFRSTGRNRRPSTKSDKAGVCILLFFITSFLRDDVIL